MYDPELEKQAEAIKQTLPEHNLWTAKAKKHAFMNFEKDGKKTSLPIAAYLKQEGLKLPPMEQFGRRVIHFNELMWRFMHGKTKDESMQAVNDYCKEIVDIWNKAVEDLRKQNEASHEDNN